MNTEKLSHPPIAPLCSSTTSGETKKQIYVQKEIKVALDVADEKPEGTIFVIPLRLSDCKVPERLQHLQWVNYFEPGGYRNLRKALSIRARQLC